MRDGHTGANNTIVKQKGSVIFQLTLAYLEQGTGEADFVIHATSNTSYSFGLQPMEFLAEIGLSHYKGRCQFYHDRCFYKEVATVRQHVYGIEHYQTVQTVHRSFEEFAENIDNLFKLRQQEENTLRQVGFKSARDPLFGHSVEIEITEKDVPLWIDEVKFSRLRELEEQQQKLQEDIDKLSVFLPLIYGTGGLLVEAVIEALHFLGLSAERTQKGFTADILAETSDGLKKFGFEVTGISGSVRKDSNKLTQVLDFERIKEHGEKTVLVANTHRETPISQRQGLEDFTTQVLDFLRPYPILLMTGLDLYRMVKDVLEGSKTTEEIIELLYTTNGKQDYAS